MLKAINILKHERLQVLAMTLVVIILGFMMTNAVTAQSIVIEEPNNCDGEGCLGFDPIQIPTFLSLDSIENFSVGSYIALGFNLIFVGIALLWVFIVVRAAVDIIRSQGQEDVLEKAKGKITGVFMSITFLFGFFVIVIIVASFFGLGDFLRWPQYLSFCDDGRLYYNHYLDLQINARGEAGPQVPVEQSCYGDAPADGGNPFDFGL